MSWRSNRRFRRDCEELIRRGHYMEFQLPMSFYVDGYRASLQDITEAAQSYRDHPTYTEEDIVQIMREARFLIDSRQPDLKEKES